MSDRIMDWLPERFRKWIKTYFYEHRTVLPVFGASVLSFIAANVATLTGASQFLVGLSIVVVATGVSIGFDQFIKREVENNERERNIHRTGYHMLNREINNYMSMLRISPADSSFVSTFTGIVHELMHKSVSDLYTTLDTMYSLKIALADHTDFEVTFMTTSIKDDDLTVAAWANRDGRAPKSLVVRETDTKIYSDTETDKLYKFCESNR